MDWLWLILLLIGLGGLWFIIWGLERLTERMKKRDDQQRRDSRALQEKIDQEERKFLQVQAAKDYIINVDNIPEGPNGGVAPELSHAMSVLSSEEFVEAVITKAFAGAPAQNPDRVTASRSAFDEEPEKVAVANGNGVLPVKTKASRKSGLSKAEQKMLKKIKQGY